MEKRVKIVKVKTNRHTQTTTIVVTGNWTLDLLSLLFTRRGSLRVLAMWFNGEGVKEAWGSGLCRQ